MTKKKWLLIGIGFLLVICVLCGIIAGTSDSEETKIEEVVTEEVVVEEAEEFEIVPEITPIDRLYDCLPENSFVEANVIEIVDGDTIKVSIDGNNYTVRYIGIDTPETKHPNKPVEFFGFEASEKNKELLKNGKVLLVKDVSETDRYSRLLRYVFVDDMFINYELVSQGYAYASTYPPDISCSELFLGAQKEAESNLRGLWLEPTEEPEVQEPEEDGREGCDSSYPTVCIPKYPPDLNCGDIPYKRFKVEGNDPHGFDRDGDGIGCQS